MRQDRRRIHGRTEDHAYAHLSGKLLVGQIDGRTRHAPQRPVVDRLDDAHDLCIVCVREVDLDPLADRVLVGEGCIGKRLVDDDHLGPVDAIRAAERPTAEHRDPHHVEEPVAHETELRVELLLGAEFEPAGNADVRVVSAPRQRQHRRRRDTFDARYGGQAGPHLVEELDAILVRLVACGRQRHGAYHGPVRLESGVDIEEPGEALDQESGPDQQNERHRHLGDDQRSPDPTGRARAAPPTGLEHPIEVRAGRRDRREQPEDQPGEYGYGDREREHPPVEGDLLDPR